VLSIHQCSLTTLLGSRCGRCRLWRASVAYVGRNAFDPGTIVHGTDGLVGQLGDLVHVLAERPPAARLVRRLPMTLMACSMFAMMATVPAAHG
jgi:hypothetical protein